MKWYQGLICLLFLLCADVPWLCTVDIAIDLFWLTNPSLFLMSDQGVTEPQQKRVCIYTGCMKYIDICIMWWKESTQFSVMWQTHETEMLFFLCFTIFNQLSKINPKEGEMDWLSKCGCAACVMQPPQGVTVRMTLLQVWIATILIQDSNKHYKERFLG